MGGSVDGGQPPRGAAGAGEEAPRRSVLHLALRAAVTVGLLTWLISRADLASIGRALAGASLPWVLLGLFLHFVGWALSAVRWQILLHAKGADAPLGFLARSLLVGSFFNHFLPSTIGGDVYRARDTARLAGSLTEAVTVVLVERVSGILALGVFVVAAPLFGMAAGDGRTPAALWAGVGLLLGCLLLAVWLLRPGPLAGIRRLLERVDRALARGGAGRAAHLLGRAERILATLETFAANPAMLRRVFLLGVLLQAAVIVHFWCVARALSLPVPLGPFFLIAPAALVILLLPVSINGIGAREAVFALLLGRYGVTVAQSLAFSWIVYGLLLVLGITGGIVHALTRRS